MASNKLVNAAILVGGLVLMAIAARTTSAAVSVLMLPGLAMTMAASIRVFRKRGRLVRYVGGSALGLFLAAVTFGIFESPETAARLARERTEREQLRAAEAASKPASESKGPLVRTESAADEPSQATPAATLPKPGLTMANYLRLENGMSYKEVTDILGGSGEEMSRSDLAGITTIMYGWKKWTGANMNAMFQNDHLVTKAQFGLK